MRGRYPERFSSFTTCTCLVAQQTHSHCVQGAAPARATSLRTCAIWLCVRVA